MLGKDLYKIDVNAELSNERLKSLVFFYAPLIGRDALSLYQYLVLNETTVGFDELNNLLVSLNISVDIFEKEIKKLNEYRLVKTLKKDNKYIFVFNNPLTRKEFVKDDVFVREFILKTSGKHYQDLTAGIFEYNNHSDYEDISETLSLDVIRNWSKEDESYLKAKPTNNEYMFNTLFDVNVFLKDVSTVLLPLRFRTKENMRQLAMLADLYSISYDKMRTYLPKVARSDSNEFDLNQLRYLCMNAKTDYSLNSDSYSVSPVLFLMKLQDGKEVTNYDKQILYNLGNNYYLNAEVINVLIEHTLKTCDNRLIEKYIYAIASDLHRNNINTYKEALNRLSISKVKEEKPITYDTSKNKEMSDEEIEQLLALRGK